MGISGSFRHHGYPRKAEQVGRDSGALRAPLSRLKLVPPSLPRHHYLAIMTSPSLVLSVDLYSWG